MALKNFQFNKIKREYDSRQLYNKRLQEQRQEEIYDAIPAIWDINRDIATMSLAAAKEAIVHDSDVPNTLHDNIQSLVHARNQLLIANGYPSDYLAPIYTCKNCKDTGYINNKKCHCFKQKIVNLLYAQSNLQDILQYENFKHFRLEYYPDDYVDDTTKMTPRDNMRKILHTCNTYVDNFSTNYENLLFYGNTGVGKTFLSNCIAKELLDRSKTVIYLTSFELFDILEKNKFNRDDSYMEANEQFHYILSCDLLDRKSVV